MRRALLLLLAGALFLPIAILLILTAGRLLMALEDAQGAALLDRLALCLGIVWALSVIALAILLAIRALLDEPRADDEASNEQ
jgi:hypothetical protein